MYVEKSVLFALFYFLLFFIGLIINLISKLFEIV